MTNNPLFPTGNDDTRPAADTTRPQPAHAPAQASNHAADLIRQKLQRLYAEEPDPAQELAEAEEAGPHRSRHQRFMHDLNASGKSLAEIQTAWHDYYARLSDDEKRQVWQEFYAHSGRESQQAKASAATTMAAAAAQPRVPAHVYPTPTVEAAPASFRQPSGQAEPADLPANYHQIGRSIPTEPTGFSGPDYDDTHGAVGSRPRLQPKHHLQSLVFGLGCGGLALLLVLFSFFNELVIAPFIQPSRAVAATPIIIGADGVAPTDKSEIIIPKINVQIPLVFDVASIKEADVQKGLERGVVHYPTTAMPGQQGNAAFFGHSSNNIFNPGNYKFAFVLLRELVPGDTFYLTRDGIAYAYQVFDRKIVEPTEVGILDPIPGKIATATLITCDPPGTTLRRLAVFGEQISPDPGANLPGAPAPAREGSGEFSLPGNSPSLWQRITSRN